MNIYTIGFRGKLNVIAEDDIDMENFLHSFKIGLSEYVSSDDPDDDPFEIEEFRFDYSSIKVYEMIDEEED